MEELTLAKDVLSAISAMVKKGEEIKADERAKNTLKLGIRRAWKVIDDMVVQGEDTFENKVIKLLAMWCYDIEDLLDKLALKAEKHKNASVLAKIVEGPLHVLESLMNSGKLQKLESRFKDILQQFEGMITYEPRSNTTTICSDPFERIPIPFVGRKDDIENIVGQLCPPEDGQLCPLGDSNGISIVGTCGVGKSSLALTVFKYKKIVEQFPLRVWVHKEDGNFSLDKTLKEIVKKSSEIIQWDKLLIVFDNLHQLMDHHEWRKFWSYKKEQEYNSKVVRIIITTRDPTISDIARTTPHHLKPLSVDWCEEVIKKYADFYDVSESRKHSQDFLQTVKSMSRKCGGLPLVAEVFGKVIATCKDVDMRELRKVESLWQRNEFKMTILPKLKSSYTNLGSELRRCVAYFSLFPVGHNFNTDELVHLWVAECFVQFIEAKTKLKEIEGKYVDDLKKRAILQPSGSGYKLHSFGQDFAMSAALGTCLQLHQGVPSLSSSPDDDARHLSFSCNVFKDESWSQPGNLSKLRTFLSLYAAENKGELGKIPPSFCKSASLLRVLSFRNTNVKELPVSINELKHLRYLDISSTSIEVLPKMYYKLHALEFFKLRNSISVLRDPKKFHKLTNLRYVDWEEGDLRKLGVPSKIGELLHLESLPLFVIEKKEGRSITELKSMNKLQGSICIDNLQYVKSTEEAEMATLQSKDDLMKIVLKWNPQLSGRDCAPDEDILTGLKPNENLKELKLVNYRGESLPNWISSSGLEKIQLMNCRSCYFPALGKLKSLKALVLEDMEDITQVSCRSNDDDTNTVVSSSPSKKQKVECFPSLESMEFHNMTQLEAWTGLQTQDLPKLHDLKFFNCPKMNHSMPFVDILSGRLESLSIIWDA